MRFRIGVSNSYYELRRYDEAIAAYQEALRRNPDFWGAHQSLAATYAEQGRQKEAHAEAAEVLRIYPGFSVNWVRDNVPFKDPVDLERTVGALQKAGLK
jgi:adenylate cyclase